MSGLRTEWIRGADLAIGTMILVSDKPMTVTSLEEQSSNWYLHPGDPIRIPSAAVRLTDGKRETSITMFPSDHYRRVLADGEPTQEALL